MITVKHLLRNATQVFGILTLAFVIFGLAGSAAAQSQGWERPAPGLLTASISFPTEGARPGSRFNVTGNLSGSPHNLWLVVKNGDLYWPKEPKVVISGSTWKGVVNEEGSSADGTYEVVLIDVSDELSKSFEVWLKQGHIKNHYPGLSESALGLPNAGAKVLTKRKFRF